MTLQRLIEAWSRPEERVVRLETSDTRRRTLSVIDDANSPLVTKSRHYRTSFYLIVIFMPKDFLITLVFKRYHGIQP